MTDEAKALVERVETLPDTHALPSTLALLFDLRDLIETQAREIDRWGALVGDNARAACKVLDEKDAEIERLRHGLDTIRAVNPAITTVAVLQEIASAALAGARHD